MKILITSDNTLIQAPVTFSDVRARYPNTSFSKSNWEADNKHDGALVVDAVIADSPGDVTKVYSRGTPVYQDDQWIVPMVGTDKTVADFRAERLKELGDYRYVIETNHPTLDTTRQTQDRLNQIWSAMQRNPLLVVQFKQPDGSFQELNAVSTDAIVGQVVDWVQACFANEKTLSDQLTAASTLAEIAAVDITQGWPE